MTDEEADARAVNAEPWEPMPGMVKVRCAACRFWFATPTVDAETYVECAIRLRKRWLIRVDQPQEAGAK